MTWWRLLLLRARWAPVVDVGVVLLLVLVGVLAAVLAVAGPAVLQAAIDQRVAATPEQLRRVEASANLDVRAPDRQDDAARRLLTGALAPLPAPVDRLLVGEILPVQGAAGARLVPWAGQAFRAHAALTAGRWPGGPAGPNAPGASSGTAAPGELEAALPADAAAALGAGVGTLLRPDRTDAASAVPPPVRVVGLWRARDPADAFWVGEPLALGGAGRAGVRGGLVVAEADVARLPVVWTAHWRAVPDLTRLAPALVDPLAGSVDALRWSAADIPSGGGPQPGADVALAAFLRSLAPLQVVIGAVRAVATLLAVVALALCGLLAVAIAQARATQTRVLGARGAGRGQRLALGLREAAGRSLPAGAIAAAAAPFVASAAVPQLSTGRLVATAAVAAAGALVGAGVLALAVEVAGRRVDSASGEGRERGAPVSAPVLVVVAVAAAVSAWQLVGAAEPGRDDLVRTLAAAALIGSSALLAVVGLTVVGALLTRAAAPSAPVTALTGWYAGRRGLRQVTVLGVVVLCACGSVCVLAARRSDADVAVAGAHVAVAPPLAVALPADAVKTGAAAVPPARHATDRLRAVSGVAAVSPVLSLPAAVGDAGPVRVLAVDASLLARMTAGAEPARIAASAAGSLATGPPVTGSGDVVPGLVRADLAARLGVGAGGGLTLQDQSTGGSLQIAVVGVADVLPADPFAADGAPVVVVDAARLLAVEAARPLPTPPPGQVSPARPAPRSPREWWVLPAPGADAAQLAGAAAAAVRPAGGGADPLVTTRAAAEARAVADPFTRGLGRLDLVAAGAMVLAGLGALLLGQLATNRRRRAELAVLRAVGLSRPQTTRLAAAEALLTGGLAVVVGGVLGAALAPVVTTAFTAGSAVDAAAGAAASGAGAVASVVLPVLLALGAGVAGVAAVRARSAVRADVAAVIREQAP